MNLSPLLRNPRTATALLALVTALAAGCATPKPGPTSGPPPSLASRGVAYSLLVRDQPRPLRIHILRVDLAAGRVAPSVLVGKDPDGPGPAEAVLTPPLALASNRPVLAFVNANAWDGFPGPDGKPYRYWHEGQPVDIGGLAVSDGAVRSPAVKSNADLRFPRRGRAVIEDKSLDAGLREGVAGFQLLVRDGHILPKPGGPLAPRTAAGLSADGALLWLAVVDGRQPGFSEGMAFDELACLMKELGCHDALNLDGGGSSVMGLQGSDGVLRIVNSPSDRLLGVALIRPVPVLLSIIPTR